jgi:serine/threonine protein kinase
MAESGSPTRWPRRYGRYLVFEEFARGGMASVHLGKLVADRGFSRVVAVKMLSQDRNASSFYARALEDEARIASRVRHPNVVQPLDVVAEGGDVLYVMEYVHGVAFAQLLETARSGGGDPRLPRDVTVAIMLDLLSALHAAHEAKDETGRALGVVHRDVSPENVLVGADGLARLLDFGVAKAMRREERTATGAVKGKPSYMAPEQRRGLPLTRQADVYAAGVVLAVALTGAAPAPVEEDLAAEWLRSMVEQIDDRDLLEIVKTATSLQSRERYATAAEMGAAISSACARATTEAVGACVQDLAGDVLDRRAELLRRVESAAAEVAASSPPPAPPPSTRPQAHTLPLGPASAAPPALASAPASASAAASAPARSFFTPLLLFLVGAALVVGAFLLRNKLDPAPTASPDVASDPVMATSLALPLVPLVPPAPSPAPSPTSSSSSAPSAPSAATASPTATAIAATPRPRPPARPRPPGPAAADPPAPPAPPPPSPRTSDCDPPFRIDAQGRKHYKPECAP